MSLIRNIIHCEPQLVLEEQKNYLFDLINESIYHIPYMLLLKIKNNIKENNEKFNFSKNDLLRIIDKDWEYYNELKKLNEIFHLTILYCENKKVQMLSGIRLILQGYMCEFSENPMKEEFIWIDKNHDFSDEEHFKELLKHELGHVWTFAFGSVNEDFKIGQIKGKEFNSIKLNNLTKKQIDVLKSFYSGKFELLKNDYNYILTETPGNGAAYEFTSICDEIIELLVNDYFELYEKEEINPNSYVINLFRKLEENRFIDYNDLNVVKHYINEKGYKEFKNIQHVKNDIRRLFLIFFFGSSLQKDYFKNELNKEFTLINKKLKNE